MKKLRKTDSLLVVLVNRLKMEKKPFWKRIAQMLERPRRRMVTVNLSKIEKYGKEGTMVVVPGKVLGDGRITKKMTIAAFKFSESARKMIEQNGGKIISISEVVENKIEPKNILLLS